MIAYAAVDLRQGSVVQLVGGDPGDERIRRDDPVEVAREWIDAGFAALHVVDLDAALGLGSNRDVIQNIIRAVKVPVQVGGGVRDDEYAAALLDAGAARVVIGTRAVQDRQWLQQIVSHHPGRIVVAADVRGEEVQVRGWREGSGQSATSFLQSVGSLELAAVLITDVAREGQMLGADTVRFSRFVKESRHPIIASGGIASIDDLRQLARAGVAGVVLGMSIYTGAIDARTVTTEFSA